MMIEGLEDGRVVVRMSRKVESALRISIVSITCRYFKDRTNKIPNVRPKLIQFKPLMTVCTVIVL